VATSTECYDFLRLLFAGVGRTFCPNCGIRVEREAVDKLAERLLGPVYDEGCNLNGTQPRPMPTCKIME